MVCVLPDPVCPYAKMVPLYLSVAKWAHKGGIVSKGSSSSSSSNGMRQTNPKPKSRWMIDPQIDGQPASQAKGWSNE